MSTFENRLDLETLGSRPIMPKICQDTGCESLMGCFWKRGSHSTYSEFTDCLWVVRLSHDELICSCQQMSFYCVRSHSGKWLCHQGIQGHGSGDIVNLWGMSSSQQRKPWCMMHCTLGYNAVDEVERARIQNLCLPSMELVQAERAQIFGQHHDTKHVVKPPAFNCQSTKLAQKSSHREPPLSYPFWTEAKELAVRTNTCTDQ